MIYDLMTLFPDKNFLTCVHRTISNVTWINIFDLSGSPIGDNIHVTNIWYLIGYLSNTPTTSKLSVCHVQSVNVMIYLHNWLLCIIFASWPRGNHYSDQSEQQTIPCFCGIQFFHHFSICLDFSRTILYYESEVMNYCGLPPPWPE